MIGQTRVALSVAGLAATVFMSVRAQGARVQHSGELREYESFITVRDGRSGCSSISCRRTSRSYRS